MLFITYSKLECKSFQSCEDIIWMWNRTAKDFKDLFNKHCQILDRIQAQVKINCELRFSAGYVYHTADSGFWQNFFFYPVLRLQKLSSQFRWFTMAYYTCGNIIPLSNGRQDFKLSGPQYLEWRPVNKGTIVTRPKQNASLQMCF